MSSFIVRFPDGTREFRYPPQPLTEGDVVWHEGQRYRVLAVVSDDGGPMTVTVELDSDDLGDVVQSERGGIVLELIG